MKITPFKTDTRAYIPLSGQGDWVTHPNITVVIDGHQDIISALDSDINEEWAAYKGQWKVRDTLVRKVVIG